MHARYTVDDAFGPEAGAALHRLADAFGERLYLAGGTARDLVMGRAPKEIDLSIQAHPKEIAKVIGTPLRAEKTLGVFVTNLAGWLVEIAAQREEADYGDARRPSTVTFTGLEQDVKRRDFTANALYICVKTGEVIDLVDGLKDIAARRLRMVGEAERVLEDAVRPLRLVRFSARLEFEIEPSLRERAGSPEAAAGLTRLSPQRLFTELSAILTGGNAHRGMELLDELGLLPVILPEVKALQGVPQTPDCHPEGDVWRHTLFLLRGLGVCEPELAWAALLHDVAKPVTLSLHDGHTSFHGHPARGEAMALEILNRLRAPRKFAVQVGKLIHAHLLPMDVEKMRATRFKAYLEDPQIEGHMTLHHLDSLASDSETGTLSMLRHRFLHPETRDEHPPLPVKGGDLLAAGVPPGPAVGQLLELAQHLHEEEGPFTPEDLLRRLAGEAPKHGLPAPKITP